MIQAVIFDFGGVFTHGERSYTRLREFDALLGWPAGTMQHRLFAGEAWELTSTGVISPEEHWARVGAELESRLPPDFFRFKGDPFHLEVINDDVVAVAQRLRSHYRLALCSKPYPAWRIFWRSCRKSRDCLMSLSSRRWWGCASPTLASSN